MNQFGRKIDSVQSKGSACENENELKNFLVTSFVDSIKGSNFVNTLKMYKL